MKKQILCACGCGQYRDKYDNRGRERKYINGHQTQKGEKNIRYKPEIHTDEVVLCLCGCGKYINKYNKKGRLARYVQGHHDHNFKKGQRPSPKTEYKRGHHLPKATEEKRRRNISLARKEMKFTKEHCDNISKGKKGKPNPKVSVSLRGKIREESRNWKGGLSFEPYGIEFNGKLKEVIRKRDKYTCQYCYRNQEEVREKLSIHHIDYDKKNNNPLNLISLCRKCHTKMGANRELWRRYFFMYQFIRLILLPCQKDITYNEIEEVVKVND